MSENVKALIISVGCAAALIVLLGPVLHVI